MTADQLRRQLRPVLLVKCAGTIEARNGVPFARPGDVLAVQAMDNVADTVVLENSAGLLLPHVPIETLGLPS